MFKEFQLPDGTWAECSKDVDKYLKRSGSAMASDFSGEYMKSRRYFLEKDQHDDFMADFVRNYKKEIWK